MNKDKIIEKIEGSIRIKRIDLADSNKNGNSIIRLDKSPIVFEFSWKKLYGYDKILLIQYILKLCWISGIRLASITDLILPITINIIQEKIIIKKPNNKLLWFSYNIDLSIIVFIP